jgi:hypothetical protein
MTQYKYRLSAKIWFEILHTRSRRSVRYPLDSVNAVLHSPYKRKFTEKELRGLSPNLHIHVSESDLYISRSRSAYYAAEKYAGPILGLYKSLTDTCM